MYNIPNYWYYRRGKATRAQARSKTASRPISSRLTIPLVIYARANIDSTTVAPLSGELAPTLGLLYPPYTVVLPDSREMKAMLEDSDQALDVQLASAQQVWVRLDGRARFRAWSKADSNLVSIVEAGLEELEARITAWNAVEAEDGRRVSGSVREVYLTWGAKRIVWLFKEIEMRQNGLKEYIEAQTLGLLPTQHLYNSHQQEEEAEDETPEGEDLFDEKYA